MPSDEFLESDQGLRILYVARLMRRLYFQIDGIEPRSKSAMSMADKISIQSAVLQHMASRRRKAFRGPIALNIRATTTEKTPSHAQTIAKNLLDLLGPPLPGVEGGGHGVLYFDDRQVRALSVSVQHGALSPSIHVTAARYADFLDDLSLACRVEHSTRSSYRDTLDHFPLGGLILRPRDEPMLRRVMGDSSIDSLMRTERYMSQKHLLSMSPFRLSELALILGAPLFGRRAAYELHDPHSSKIEETIRSNPLRVTLPELPQRPGEARTYRQIIGEKLDEFQNQFASTLRPLLHPVAMEVLVKPPPLKQNPAVHDLDNLARNHLIPAVAAHLQPPFYGPWELDREGRTGTHSEATQGSKERFMPASTKIGLTRYTVFEQARTSDDESPGCVTLSLVGDDGGFGAIFTRIDTVIDNWEDSL